MKVFGYARVSSKDQNLEIQIAEIKKYCDYRKLELMNIYQDKASGKNTDRPGFKDMMEALKTNALGIEAVVIFRLDRMGRSLLDLINISNTLKDWRIGFIAINNNIDTTTKEGRLFFYFMGAMGEYEREQILEKTALGLKYAKEKGTKLGRPVKNINVGDVKAKLASGIPKTRIAKELGIHVTTLYKKLKNKEATA